MINPTQSEVENIAGNAGWDSFTLLLLIIRWLDANGFADSLIAHLRDLAADEENFDLPSGD